LLNDLVRYWRTIAVDFESKMRARKGEGWGLRNAKLRLSRKALFAGGLLPVLECYRHPVGDMLGYLDDRMSVPPLDRLADAFVDREALDSGVRALSAYDEFLTHPPRGRSSASCPRRGKPAAETDRFGQARQRLGQRSATAGVAKALPAGVKTRRADQPQLHLPGFRPGSSRARRLWDEPGRELLL
jgi:hypothetical protein